MERILHIGITDIAEVFTVCVPRGRHLKITDRAFFGLSFCKSGKITYTHGESKTVSVPSCAVILPQGQTYELYNDEGGEFPLINFYADKAFTEQFLTIPIANLEPYLADFDRLKALSFTGADRLKALQILYGMFDRLYYEDKNASGILTPVVEQIHHSFSDPTLCNSTLARSASISEVYLRRLFSEKYGTTPKQYILDLRIRQAKIHLTETDRTVTEIAALCGFSGVYHFCRAFKQKTGLTPTDYRKTNRVVRI